MCKGGREGEGDGWNKSPLRGNYRMLYTADLQEALMPFRLTAVRGAWISHPVILTRSRSGGQTVQCSSHSLGWTRVAAGAKRTEILGYCWNWSSCASGVIAKVAWACRPILSSHIWSSWWGSGMGCRITNRALQRGGWRKRLEDWTKVEKWLPRCIKSISDENLVSDWKPATLEIRVGSMRNEPVWVANRSA